MILFKQTNHLLTSTNPDLCNHIHIITISITVIIPFMLIVMTTSRVVVVIVVMVERGIKVVVVVPVLGRGSIKNGGEMSVWRVIS